MTSTPGEEKTGPEANREEWIASIVGKQPAAWLWAGGAFLLFALIAGTLNIRSAGAWAFPVAFGTYLLRCWPYWAKKRRLRQLNDSELQRLLADAKARDAGAWRKERS